VTATSLARLESGRVNPSWATVRGIARALDVPMSELAALADELDPPAGR
jgi:transcriptional regulator with XRE-family HTH domain